MRLYGMKVNVMVTLLPQKKRTKKAAKRRPRQYMHKLYRSTGLCDVIENGVLVGESPTLR